MIKYKIIFPKEFLLTKLMLTLIYFVLEVYYLLLISDKYEYMKFTHDVNLLKYAVSKFVYFLLLFASYEMFNRSKFLYSVYILLIFFFYIPNAVLFSMGNFDNAPFFSTTFFVSFFLLTPYVKFRFPDFQPITKYKHIILLLISILIFIPIFLTFKLNINFNTLLLKEVYETRKIFSEKLMGYLGYLYNIEAKTILPIALVYFMIHKKPFMQIISLIILIYLYVISGNKLVYFTTVIVLFYYYLGTDYVNKIQLFLLITLFLFALFPVLDNFVLSEPMLAGTFVNRLLFIPALLTQFYFDFFNTRPFYFAESHFFNTFFENPYNMQVGFLITKEYWNNSDAFANNGIVSDGFMNLQYIGVFIYSFIFSLLFSVFNSFDIDKRFFGIYFSYIYLILSLPLLSVFLTSGVFIFIIISFLFLRKNKLSY